MADTVIGATQSARLARSAALLLISVPVLEIVAMAHHPTVRAAQVSEAMAQLRQAGALSAHVHGGLIALMVLQFLALVEFARWRDLARAAVRVGILTYGAGVLAMMAAALVSGFVTPQVVFLNPGVTPADLALTAQFAAFAMLFNQAFAPCGAILMSVGIAAWSLDLIRGGVRERALAALGLLIGAGGVLALSAGALHLDVHGMTLVTVSQAIWTIGAGGLLLTRSRQPPASASGNPPLGS
jgi:hypothetical protein